ncbi:Tm-1-like ATP-binding domain-containing protein [Rathayibacter soli]|uniref:Tm-1-like ATP-binding domain-containing protein n=1 Tax=Rathayibacter soli TaxID=3144168 RepID=UPI0027E4C76F|nr:Tm-1-like ATP-binding domain-containing protein [Glaciibacter superstes]
MTGTARAPHPRIILAGALDTKGEEYGFVRDRLKAAGIPTLLLDTGVLGSPSIPVDIDRRSVAQAAGADLDILITRGDRNEAVISMAQGAAAITRRMYDDGTVAAVIVLGGSNAGFVMSQIAAALPVGCPKILVSTIVAGDTRPYVGTSDLTMIYPVVDIAGLNSISIPVLAQAADACAGMVMGAPLPEAGTAPAIACTMFGVTTTCVTAVHDALIAQGDEVHVFHANGTGGRTLEAMTRSGFFAAVADVTTTELADELLGGVCSAGPERLEAAATHGVPQVVSVGALDMVNFGAPDTIPQRFTGRLFHAHNPAVTLMRTNATECAELGAILARKLNMSTAAVEMLVPSRGFSQISVEGAPFHDPEADIALIESLRDNLDARIPLRVIDAAINDQSFAAAITSTLNALLASTPSTTKGNTE